MKRVLQNLETQLSADLSTIEIKGLGANHPSRRRIEKSHREAREELLSLNQDHTPDEPTLTQLLPFILSILAIALSLAGLAYFIHCKAKSSHQSA
ncbi:hypothetical protein N9921_01310 [Akkermansiaceae bacterium]|nr:hypothetical protein [Akkermansiaceae bacterium]